jgi:hypothetical protein
LFLLGDFLNPILEVDYSKDILLINKQRKISKQFENHFWSGVSLDELHTSK